MTVPKQVEEYLKQQGVSYETLQHPKAFSAMKTASAQHIPGKHVLKAVIVRSGEENVMCVLDADHLIDFDQLKNELHAESIELTAEDELKSLFPGSELGAEPPFGPMYGMQMIADKSMKDVDEVIFNAGTHTDAIKMKTKDFLHITNPAFGNFGIHV